MVEALAGGELWGREWGQGSHSWKGLMLVSEWVVVKHSYPALLVPSFRMQSVLFTFLCRTGMQWETLTKTLVPCFWIKAKQNSFLYWLLILIFHYGNTRWTNLSFKSFLAHFISFFFKKRFTYSAWKQIRIIYSKGEKPSIHWFIPQMAAMARAGRVQSWEPAASFGFAVWVPRSEDLGLPQWFSQAH